MKTLKVKVSDALMAKLEKLGQELDLPADELLARLAEERLAAQDLNEARDFEPIGFGLWRDRADMDDPPAWVRRLRKSAWCFRSRPQPPEWPWS